MKINYANVAQKKEKLAQVAVTLKQEFFGLDAIIDRIIESVYAWYVFPELIHRPVIINLWGMTGVGKTQLVRRLVVLLEYSSKFVEVQMDGTSGGYYRNNLCSILSSCIEEKEPGIVLLDEIQRFRTVADDGTDVKVERYQDVWALLSDGKFASDSDMFGEIEMLIAQSEYYKSKETPEDAAKKTADQTKFKIYPYEAKSLKKKLKLSESIQEIMCWDSEKLGDAITKLKSNKEGWEIDYTKCLIFISGNLDTAFMGSRSAGDCDTDADFYHEVTKKISSTDIKSALGRRFKPEQISRLGSTHIIYPSMSRASYEKLISATAARYITEMTDLTGITFTLDESVFRIIYDNAVYPTQGTRPVFSAIHNILAHSLVNITTWALENNVQDVALELSDVKKQLIGTDTASSKTCTANVELEISTRKRKTSSQFLTMVAVHEAGHALMHALLYKVAPSETKINATSYSNGYILDATGTQQDFMHTKSSLLDRICINLAGSLAEQLVFGEENRSCGNIQDLKTATSIASNIVRNYGFDKMTSYVESPANTSIAWNTDILTTNDEVEQILIKQHDRVNSLLKEHKEFLIKIVDALLANETLNKEQFTELAKDYVSLQPEIFLLDYMDKYNVFSNSK